MIGQLALPIAQGGPVIPTFNRGSSCVRENRQFCWDWFSSHWSSTFQPRLVEHIELTAIAVGIGFVIALVAALLAYRWDWFVNPATGACSRCSTRSPASPSSSSWCRSQASRG